MKLRSSLVRFSAAALLAAAATTAFITARPARAQVDLGRTAFDLYENGERVGQVYREGSDPNTYVEHWVMFPRYIYPSPANGMRVILVPGSSEYRDAADFLARVPFEAGSRYARADIFDSERIPGR